MTSEPPPDPRIGALRDAILRVRGGRSEGIPPEPVGDELDQILAGVRSIGEEVAEMRAFEAETASRIGELSEMIQALSVLDFGRTAHVSEKEDLVDGFAVGLNVLAAELSASTISKEYADNIIESMTDGLLVVWPDGRVRTSNKGARELLGYSMNELAGLPLERLLPGASAAAFIEAGGASGLEPEMQCRAKDGREIPVSVSASVMLDSHGEPEGVVLVTRDLTEAKRRAEERWRLREAMQRQAILLEELSTPILPVAPYVLVMPLVGPLDEQRARWLAEGLLRGIAARGARLAILDITGLRSLGVESIHGILRAVQAASLLGAEVVLTGVGPDAAQAIADMDADMSGVASFRSLERGIRYALRGGAPAK